MRRYLDDAFALAQTSQIPADARAVVVAGYCRNALEAACHEVIRARRITAGVRHADVERELAGKTLHEVVALALFDDTSQGAQVTDRLRQRAGQTGVSAFRAAKSGTHEAYHGDLMNFVRDSAALAGALRA